MLMPSALEFLAFAAQSAFYSAALIVTGLSINKVIDHKSEGWIATSVLATIAALLFATKLALANAELAGSLSGLFNPGTFKWIWNVYELRAFTFLAGLALTFAGLWFRLKPLLGLGAVLISVSFTMTGHTRALPHPGVWPWIGAVHVLIAGFWVSAPIYLWPRSNLAPETVSRRMTQFSRLALWSVPIVFVAGILLAPMLAGGWGNLLTTAYGQLLLSKLFLASAALGLGAYNKLAVTPLLISDFDKGRNKLKRTLLADAVIFFSIICIIAWATTINGPDAP